MFKKHVNKQKQNTQLLAITDFFVESFLENIAIRIKLPKKKPFY